MTSSITEHTPLIGGSGGKRTSSSPWLHRLKSATVLALGVIIATALVQLSIVANQLLARLDDFQRLPPLTSHLSTTSAAASIECRPATSNATRVLIVYSDGIHLRKLAESVERGVLGVVANSSQLRSRTVATVSFADDVMWADAIILGSHVVNANVEPKMAEFVSTWQLSEDLSHKIGAAFVTSGGMSAGEELTMVNLLHSMMIFRMIIVGGERWTSAFGASAIVSEGPFQSTNASSSDNEFATVCYSTHPDDIHAMFKAKAEGLGRRVAAVAAQLAMNN